MDTQGMIILYVGIAAVYSWFPSNLRPTTWAGWIVFLLTMLFATPVFALPVSMLVCWMLDNYSGGSSDGMVFPDGL